MITERTRRFGVLSAATLAACSLGAANAVAEDETVCTNKDLAEAQATFIAAQQKVDFNRAAIKSQSDLDRFLTTNIASPLDKLNAADKSVFLSSLRFNEKGLTSYNYEVLERNLSVSEIYDVLSLFGAQRTLHFMTNASAETDEDQAILALVNSYDKICTLRDCAKGE